MVQPTDEDLLLAARSGDTDSFGVLVGRWEGPLFRFAYRMLKRREDARDVCQDTFFKVFRKADRFNEGASFSTWMYQIALNLCRDRLRHRRRWHVVDTSPVENASAPAAQVEGAAAPSDPAAALEARERREAVARALVSLSPEQREVLVLKEFEGLKFREIAAILGCPESTVKSRMYYGLSSLREALVREGIDAL